MFAIETLPVLIKFTSTVIWPLDIAFAKSYVVFDVELPWVKIPPLDATIVAVGKSSTLNPVPFAETETLKNWFVPSVVTTLAEKPVPFNFVDTEIVSLLDTNTSLGIPVNVIWLMPVLAGYISTSDAAAYAVFDIALLPVLT